MNQKYNKKCLICNKEFKTSWNHTKFCSNNCRKIYADKHYQEKVSNGYFKTNGLIKLRFLILQRDNFRCQYCGATPKDEIKLQIDHIVPISKGGKTIENNLITSCELCNLGKSDILLTKRTKRQCDTN